MVKITKSVRWGQRGYIGAIELLWKLAPPILIPSHKTNFGERDRNSVQET